MSQRVVVTDHAFRDVEFEMAIAAKHGAEFECFSCDEQEETIAAIKDADVAFVNFAPMTEAVLSRFKPGATLIRYGIGYDNVDIEAAKKFGVAVANVPDYGVETVADHATSSLLAIMRRLPVYDSLIKANGWAKPAEVGSLRGFRSTTIGLVGFGRIAQAVHRRLAPFGFRFVAFDPFCGPEVFERLNVTSVSLQELSEQAHAVSLHAPSTPENHHLIGSEFLARMQRGSFIVNTARGPLVDLEALAEAVADGRIAGAALDVTDPEPLPADSPLRGFPQVVLTPHAAFYDDDSLANLQRLASEEAGRALNGEPLRCRIA
ncbi:C-terminal binding protein [Paeniglutamicibacter cryotolerans]|uniref:D-3-phosphoglycerate dehydrogenase n=1 Tax=Paeniglutamicibacter cryotolerans TaxID=670079 RepID=A0A839QR28_9MICC|nr:C-terminal binding protein [Paeniglutamicibacter cryotolerans]MBB2995712.1 D-3-phosphoglycerate dehydrogenase [Paeniglutamicibacter cryotolerans]